MHHHYSFVEQVPSRRWSSDAFTEAIGGLYKESGVCWRYGLPQKGQERTKKSREGRERYVISILTCWRCKRRGTDREGGGGRNDDDRQWQRSGVGEEV